MEHIGAQLERQRLDRGISQEEAAERLGVSQSTFSRWVVGQSPKAQHWTKIARFLGIPRDEVARLVNDARAEDPVEARLDAIEETLAELREAIGQLGRRRS